MLTEKDFIEKFQNYSDDELYNISSNIDGYSEEAQSALKKVIESKGGLDRLTTSIDEQKKIATEIKRIQIETNKLGSGGFDEEFIKKTATSNILSKEQVQEIIDKQYDHLTAEVEDKKIDPQTIGRCVAGGIISSLVCGIAFGTFIIFTGAISILIIIGLALACFAIVKAIVKKSSNNSAVILTTLISFIIAFTVGYFLFQFIGPKL